MSKGIGVGVSTGVSLHEQKRKEVAQRYGTGVKFHRRKKEKNFQELEIMLIFPHK